MVRYAFRPRRLKARWRLMRRGSYVVYLLRPLLAFVFLFVFFVFCLAALKNRGAPAAARFDAAHDSVASELLGS